MSDVLTTALEAMQHDLLRLKLTAQNLSASSVPGAQAQHALRRVGAATAASEFQQLMNNASSAVGAAVAPALTESLPATVHVEIMSDTGPGTLKATGQPLDVALTVPGYFEVRTDEGIGYVRRGDFQRDAQGRLMTFAGHAVMGTSGEILLSGPAPSIDAYGKISESGKVVGQLQIMQPAAGVQMTPGADGVWRTTGEMTPFKAREAAVSQGFLENSNVVAAREMVDVTTTTRHFESMQKMIQGYDDMMGIALRRLGEF